MIWLKKTVHADFSQERNTQAIALSIVADDSLSCCAYGGTFKMVEKWFLTTVIQFGARVTFYFLDFVKNTSSKSKKRQFLKTLGWCVDQLPEMSIRCVYFFQHVYLVKTNR